MKFSFRSPAIDSVKIARVSPQRQYLIIGAKYQLRNTVFFAVL